MSSGLEIYLSKETMAKAAHDLTQFGLETVKKTKCLNEIERLKELKQILDSGRGLEVKNELAAFAFEWLIDTIRIVVFFENHMKATLVYNGFCVHEIQNVTYFKELRTAQQQRPISVNEISEIEPAKVDSSNEIVIHFGIKSNYTVGFETLLKPDYTKHYDVDLSLIPFLNKIRTERNKLHFHGGIDFSISDKMISDLQLINEYTEGLLMKFR